MHRGGKNLWFSTDIAVYLGNGAREAHGYYQWCGLRPSVLGQDWSETKKSVLDLVLVLQAVVLVLVMHTVVCCTAGMQAKTTA